MTKNPMQQFSVGIISLDINDKGLDDFAKPSQQSQNRAALEGDCY